VKEVGRTHALESKHVCPSTFGFFVRPTSKVPCVWEDTAGQQSGYQMNLL